ncbi:MAG: hypothetical protein ABF753_10975, partial [Lentilactobacillus hilgardii]|uniref:hypothetical protein n=1 Tax=Lentilactobacillus hilgardii TaxID=1588 RepID=UPI0039E98535
KGAPTPFLFLSLNFTVFRTLKFKISSRFKWSFQILKNIDEEITKYSQFRPFLVKFILYIKSMKKR